MEWAAHASALSLLDEASERLCIARRAGRYRPEVSIGAAVVAGSQCSVASVVSVLAGLVRPLS